jgi:hypothetical protein
VTVHHVHVDPVSPSLLGLPNLVAQSGKIGSENGRGQLDLHGRILESSDEPGVFYRVSMRRWNITPWEMSLPQDRIGAIICGRLQAPSNLERR